MPRHPITPTPLDDVSTDSSASLVSTELDISDRLLPWMDRESKSSYQPIDSVLLCRTTHMSFIYPHLSRLMAHFVVLDASRGWIMSWILGALATLGTRVKDDERLDAIETILSFQHPQGGFGGGPGQIAHLASTYASICALAALLDGAKQSLVDETWARINTKAMYSWILSLKLPDGSFAMHYDGETDARGCFAALVLATVLNMLTPELVQNVQHYIVSCQTYEGGLAASSITSPHGQEEGMAAAAPTGEAHGGYALCALASYFMLQGLPSLKDAPKLNYESCLRWASQMQGLPIEGGGFRGRTNKLVDGCYSWWCGGMFGLLRALMFPDSPEKQLSMDLYDRQALQEYILLVSQDLTPKSKQGGLRDKPSESPDLYHTQYILSGLSIAQRSPIHTCRRVAELKEKFATPDFFRCIIGQAESDDEATERMKEIYARTLAWECKKENELVVGLVSNKVPPVHPIFHIQVTATESIMKYFYHQSIPSSRPGS